MRHDLLTGFLVSQEVGDSVMTYCQASRLVRWVSSHDLLPGIQISQEAGDRAMTYCQISSLVSKLVIAACPTARVPDW